MPQITLQDPEIRKYLEEMVSEAVARFVAENELRAKEISLVERVIRVEEELKALREIQIAQMEAIEKRFEAMEKANQQRFEAMEKADQQRFEAIEKRFESLQREMDRRFEAMEKRLTFLQWSIGVGFTLVSSLIGVATYIMY